MPHYWTRHICRYPEDFDEDNIYDVWIVGDEDGDICEFTDREDFEKFCTERGIRV